MDPNRKPGEKPQSDQQDPRRGQPEGGARAKPMREKDREDWEDKRKSQPLKTQH